MTREEAFENLDALAKSINGKLVDYSDVSHLIDAVYNDFNSRICKNCKYYEIKENYRNKVCVLIDDKMSEHYMGYFMPQPNFGCNRFKRRIR